MNLLKPKKIVLIRHGESVGNVDNSVYLTTPDHRIPLTDKGLEQSKNLAPVINSLIFGQFMIFVSPFTRARQTLEALEGGLRSGLHFSYFKQEDPRLAEQNWGTGRGFIKDGVFHLEARKDLERARFEYGTFWYKFHEGESVAEVYNRVSNFFLDKFISNQYDNWIIVTHGMTMRVALMYLIGATVDEFHSWKTPLNCEYFDVRLEDCGYVLKNSVRKRRKMEVGGGD